MSHSCMLASSVHSSAGQTDTNLVRVVRFTPQECADLLWCALVLFTVVIDWVATAAFHFSPATAAAETFFRVSLGMHFGVGILFAIVLSLTQVKGLQIPAYCAYLTAILIGMLGLAPVTLVFVTCHMRVWASTPAGSKRSGILTEHSSPIIAWLRGIALVANVPVRVIPFSIPCYSSGLG